LSEVVAVAEKYHWPFGKDPNSGEARELERAREREVEREAERAAARFARFEMRNNRLLVGGRAHTRKPGLS
jgi:hypothetical protein